MIERIGVVGAGNMGAGIAQKMAQEGLNVTLVDVSDEFVTRGLDNIRRTLAEGVARRIFRPAQVEATLARITGTTDLAAVADADLVVEAVFEDRQVKTELFDKLDQTCGERTILATNTSSFRVADFARRTRRPDRFLGLHYFYHPAKNRLLEVVPHAGTSRETLAAALLVARLHGKTAIVVGDVPGFAVNRFFVPFLNEAVRMLEENFADLPTIEAGGKQAFRIGMGPFALMNLTGIPIAFHAATTLGDELGSFYAPAARLKQQVDRQADWDLADEVDETRLAPVADRFLGVCLGVAAQLVDEGIASIEDTDRGAKLGLRWPLGPFELMNRLGLDRACELVAAVADRYPDFALPELLRRQRARGRPFAFRCVDLAVDGRVATLTLNRPEAMNALNEAVVEQLARRFAEAQDDPAVETIVLRGAGKAFVAGADIRYFVKQIDANRIGDIVAFTRRGHELLAAIEASPKPVIALLDGLSLGGGSELALACRAIVATPAGSLGFPETGLGIYPGLGGTQRLSRSIGVALARYFILTGFPIDAELGARLGLIAAVVPPGEVDAWLAAWAPEGEKYGGAAALPDELAVVAEQFADANIEALLAGELIDPDNPQLQKVAKALSRKAPLALRLANRLITMGSKLALTEGLALELAHLAEIFATPDAYEGLTALGKRHPRFTGGN